MRKQKGITIISLVVTIIILIILAGVSINLVLGENGIITKAKEAKTKTEQATLNEEIALNELYMQIEAEGIGSAETTYDSIAKLIEFKKEIASAITDMGITTSKDADATTMASNIRSISGASSADKVSYNNTNSGLSSTNVQGVIDEVNNNLDNKVGVLDYSNPISINSLAIGGSYTVANDGLFNMIVSNSTSTNMSFRIEINGTTVAHYYGSCSYISKNLFVSSGDIITLRNNDAGNRNYTIIQTIIIPYK